MYKLEDLSEAENELKRWDDAFANDSSNNPNKYEAQRRDARSKVQLITEHLKLSGIIERLTQKNLTVSWTACIQMLPPGPS